MARPIRRPLAPLGFESAIPEDIRDPVERDVRRTLRSVRLGLMRRLGLSLGLSRHGALLNEMEDGKSL